MASIERHILGTSPTLKEESFIIESKKIINVGGVHHEIDIFVTIDPGDGYKSIFIFECKNWRESVGKNEVVVFAEKISATQAQHGYFVAKSFTKDAEAQASTNARISLLRADEREPSDAPVPFGFHIVMLIAVNGATTFFARGGDHSKTNPLSLDGSTAKLAGTVIDLKAYLNQWAIDAAHTDSRSFRSERVPDGEHERTAKVCREFQPGEFLLNERDVERAESSVTYNLRVIRPAVVSYFEIQTRGRAVTLAPVQLPTGPSMQLTLTSR